MFTLPIKKFRRMRGLTLEQLAELSGVSASYISRLEADNVIRNRTPKLSTIEDLAISLKICPRDIVLYSCDTCQQAQTCPKKKVDLDDIIEDNLSFYI